ncbi:MAG: hypothetical protein ACTTJC_07560 [Campylobacter sp.]
MFKFSVVFLFLLLFFGCSSKNDPFEIGLKPIPPIENFKSPSPIKFLNSSAKYLSQSTTSPSKNGMIIGASNSAKSSKKPNLLQSSGSNFPDIFDKTSDPMMIMASNSVVITVWAIAPRNWLWAYSPNSSAGLGNYRVWKFVFLPRNEVLILNSKTRTTCVNTYGSGVIHDTCDADNAMQRFVIRPMSNGAVQIYNPARDMCLQTPIDNVFGFDDFGEIALTKCANTIDQQWYLLPPPSPAVIVF